MRHVIPSESLTIGPIACISSFSCRHIGQNTAVLVFNEGISSQTELTNHINEMLNLRRVQKIRQLTSWPWQLDHTAPYRLMACQTNHVSFGHVGMSSFQCENSACGTLFPPIGLCHCARKPERRSYKGKAEATNSYQLLDGIA